MPLFISNGFLKKTLAVSSLILTLVACGGGSSSSTTPEHIPEPTTDAKWVETSQYVMELHYNGSLYTPDLNESAYEPLQNASLNYIKDVNGDIYKGLGMYTAGHYPDYLQDNPSARIYVNDYGFIRSKGYRFISSFGTNIRAEHGQVTVMEFASSSLSLRVQELGDNFDQNTAVFYCTIAQPSNNYPKGAWNCHTKDLGSFGEHDITGIPMPTSLREDYAVLLEQHMLKLTIGSY
ncbi:hypothetical protein A3Q34_00050 [Colwellia sp. PAMC 20917]|uniref:hypothetical protein n=1 Tax=Colwellia sp. PAMC 20917 TaxID=1816218 RepID=UPI000878F372|nr:hypothetical protein [Colwellia sp. PAMC 20917]AOW75416.1 hypothetical protein A3Q34_00050 [Colwellia sp. PAMC 20917]